MIPAPHRYRDPRVPTDLRRLISTAVPNPLVIVWRWRYEIALVSGLTAGLSAAIISFGAAPTIIAVIVITLTILCWPPARRDWQSTAPGALSWHTEATRSARVEGLIYSSRGKIPVHPVDILISYSANESPHSALQGRYQRRRLVLCSHHPCNSLLGSRT